ncbi:hypothetical protein Dimus_022271 [Dionaea muscipula]
MDNTNINKAHRYALFNCRDEEVEKYISEHQTLMESFCGSKWARAQNHSNDFISWFEKKVMTGDVVDDHIAWLAKGPNPVDTKYDRYVINGYHFHTRACDARCKTQNSRQLTIERKTSSRKKHHGPQNSLVHETYTKEVGKLHKRQELHKRQQLTIERRPSPRKKHHGPQNSLVHETYTKEVGMLHEIQDKRKQVAREFNMEETEFTEEQEVQEELNVDLP